MIVPKLVLCMATLIGCVEYATWQDAPSSKVTVTVVVILASEEGNAIDARLKAIAEEVQAKEPKFKSFKLKSMECRPIGKDEKADFLTVDRKIAHVVAKTCAGKNNRVCLAVTPPELGEIVYESVCGKFLPIVTPYQTESKERLILAIRVMPCKGE